jgi:phosphatidylglycerophosphate synthase
MMERKNLRTIYGLLFKSGRTIRLVNLITLYRIVTAPLLLALAFSNNWILFKWLLLASFSTDAVDGYLARKFKAVSILGSKLDSLGDDLTVLVGLIALLKLHPEFCQEQMMFFLVLLALFLIQFVSALLKYRRTTSFHTYFAKLAAVLQGCFLLSVYFFETIYYPLFYFAVAVTAVELAEEIIMVFVLPEWKSDVKGLYWAMKEKGRRSR